MPACLSPALKAAFLHFSSCFTSLVLDAAQYGVHKYIQVLALRDVPVGAVEAVLQLLTSTIWPHSDTLIGGDGGYRDEF